MNIRPLFHLALRAVGLSIAVCICASIVFSGVSIAQEKETFEVGDGSSRIVVSPWEKVDVGTDANFRGLHVVSDKVIWASGSGGTVIVSSDSGKTWRQRNVEGLSLIHISEPTRPY